MIWIVYDKIRIVKNQSFVNMLIEEFAKHKIKAKLVFAENIKRYKNFPVLAIMRSDKFQISKFLEQKNVIVCNNSAVTEICNDKYKTYLSLKNQNIPTVPTFEYNELNKLNFPIVVKSKAGHGGSEVFLSNNMEQLENIIQPFNKNALIFQPLVDVGKDKRTYIIGNKIIVSMLRENNKDFRANFSLGGCASQTSLTKEEQDLIEKVLNCFYFDFAGIDIIYSNKSPYINEIEDIVGCRMVYNYTNIDLVKLYVNYLIEKYKLKKTNI